MSPKQIAIRLCGWALRWLSILARAILIRLSRVLHIASLGCIALAVKIGGGK